MLMVGGWLFLRSNPNTCFLLFVILAENGMLEEMRDKGTNEAIKTHLYYYGRSQLSLERGRLP